MSASQSCSSMKTNVKYGIKRLQLNGIGCGANVHVLSVRYQWWMPGEVSHVLQSIKCFSIPYFGNIVKWQYNNSQV